MAKRKKKAVARKRPAVKKRPVKRPAKRKAAPKRKPAAKLNPAKFKKVNQSSGWMPASAVRFVKRGGKMHVLVRRKGR